MVMEPNDGEETPSDTLHLLGRSQVKNTVFGKVRATYNLGVEEWLFLVFSMVAVGFTIALTLSKLVLTLKNEDEYVYIVLIVMNIGFLFMYSVHGVFTEQPYEIAVFVGTVVVIMVYEILHYFSFDPNNGPSPGKFKELRLTMLIAVCVLSPMLTITGCYLIHSYMNSCNFIFRSVGANIQLQKMCFALFRCQSLLWFDLQTHLSVILTFIKEGISNFEPEEILVMTIGVLYILLFRTVGYMAMRLENDILAVMFMLLSPFTPAYIVWNFIQMVEYVSIESVLFKTFLAAGILSIVIRILLLINFVSVYNHFGMGLKEKVYEPVMPSSRLVNLRYGSLTT